MFVGVFDGVPELEHRGGHLVEATIREDWVVFHVVSVGGHEVPRH